MRFLSLPDDCLRIILSRISLSDLCDLCSVCARLCAIIEIVLQNKHSLKLFTELGQLTNYRSSVRSIGSCDYCLNDVLYLSESGQYVKTRTRLPRTIKTSNGTSTTKSSQVASLLPSIRSLVSVITSLQSPIDLVNLFGHWSTSLVSVTLCRQGSSRTKEDENTFHRICLSMDCLVALKQLHIYGIANWTLSVCRV